MKEISKYILLIVGFFSGFFIQIWRANVVPAGPTPTVQVTPTLTPGQLLTVSGEFTCLPHKNTSGPQTMECALGIKDTDGKYYAMYDPDMKYITTMTTGKKITVTGLYRNDTVQTSNYDIVGSIQIQSLIQ